MSSPQVSRRTLARGAAWTVPMVAVVVAAPAYAVSQTYTPMLTAMSGCRCGTGGGVAKPYRLDVTFNNTSVDDFTITLVDISVTNGTAIGETLLVTSPTQTNVLPAGQVKTLKYGFVRGANPTSDTVTFAYRVTNLTTGAFFDKSVPMAVNWSTCSDTCT